MLHLTPAGRRTLIAGVAVAALGLTIPAGTGTASAGDTNEPTGGAARTAVPPGTLTNFGFDAASFGSQTTGNPNADSGPTALSFVPCTRYVPRSGENFVAQGGDGDGVSVQGVSTHNFTQRLGGATSAISVVQIASGTLAQGQVAFTDVVGRVRSFHGSAGYDVVTASSVGSLTVNGVPVDVPAPGEEAEIPVPGAGTLILNHVVRNVTASSATGTVNVVRFEGDDGSTEKIGRAFSRLDGEIEGGLFAGSAWGSDARTGDAAAFGQGALRPIPCPGTRGKVLANETGQSRFDFGSIGARRSSVYGVQRENASATGWTHSHVDGATFGGGQLRFRNINAFANVTRFAGGAVARDADGTGVGAIFVNDEQVQPPAPGQPQGIAGLGTFTVRSVQLSDNGIAVTAVVVRLSNGTPEDTTDDTVVNLGQARLAIRQG